MCSEDVNDCVECALCIACCYACCLCCCKDKSNSSVANQPPPAIISQPQMYGGGGQGYPQQDPYGQYPYGQQQKDGFGYGNPNAMMMQGGGGQYPGQFGTSPYPATQPGGGPPPPYSFHQGPPAPGSYFPPQGSENFPPYYPPNAPPAPLYPTVQPEHGKY